MSVREKAQAVLDASEEYRAINAAEPAKDDEGMPLNPAVWVRWYEVAYVPARDRLNAAHAALELERGGVPHSRHPFHYRPLCESLLSS